MRTLYNVDNILIRLYLAQNVKWPEDVSPPDSQSFFGVSNTTAAKNFKAKAPISKLPLAFEKNNCCLVSTGRQRKVALPSPVWNTTSKLKKLNVNLYDSSQWCYKTLPKNISCASNTLRTTPVHTRSYILPYSRPGNTCARRITRCVRSFEIGKCEFAGQVGIDTDKSGSDQRA